MTIDDLLRKPTADELDDNLKYTYGRAFVQLGRMADQLAALAFRGDPIGRDQQDRLQHDLLELSELVFCTTISDFGLISDKGSENDEVYSDGTSIWSQVSDRDVTTSRPAPAKYYSGDLLDRLPGTDITVVEPPHRRQ
jgi:hypothetical protein